MVSAKFVVVGACILVTLIVIICNVSIGGNNAINKGGTIVNLFEWKYSDIAIECEQFLSQYGYTAVQISPPNEHRVITGVGFSDTLIQQGSHSGSYMQNSWIGRYQPISYSLSSRGGNQNDLQNMISRCNNVGVAVFVDIQINQMSSFFSGSSVPFSLNPINNIPKGMSSGSSNFISCRKADCGNLGGIYSDGAKFGCDSNWNNCLYAESTQSFHPDCPSVDPTDPNQIQNCPANNLFDVNTGKPNQIIKYLNSLIDLGVQGFRVDSARLVSSYDLITITKNIKQLPNGNAAYFYSDIYDFNSPLDVVKASNYFQAGDVENYFFMLSLWQGFTGSINSLWNFCNINFSVPSARSVVFSDTPTSQRGLSPSSFYNFTGVKTKSIRSKDSVEQYILANVFLLANPFGLPKITSSYDWVDEIVNDGVTISDLNYFVGPPSNNGIDTNSVFNGTYSKCFQPRTKASSGLATDANNWDNLDTTGGWKCEHRYNAIANANLWRQFVSNGDWSIYNVKNDVSGVLCFSRMSVNGWMMGSTFNSKSITTGGWIGLNNGLMPYTLPSNYKLGLSSGFYCDTYSSRFYTNTNGVQFCDANDLSYSYPGNVIYIQSDGTSLLATNNFDSDGNRTLINAVIPSLGGILLSSPAMMTSFSLTGPPSRTNVPRYTPITNRTVIFIHGKSSYNQNMYIQGGLSPSLPQMSGNCLNNVYCVPKSSNLSLCPCAIQIKHLNLKRQGGPYDSIFQSQVNDNYLDWYGAEIAQGGSGSGSNAGTPLTWTTSMLDAQNFGIAATTAINGYGGEILNKEGTDFWMLDIEVNCSKTINNKFEIQSYFSNGPGFEGFVNQNDPDFINSKYHVVQCGRINVFKRGSPINIVRDFV